MFFPSVSRQTMIHFLDRTFVESVGNKYKYNAQNPLTLYELHFFFSFHNFTQLHKGTQLSGLKWQITILEVMRFLVLGKSNHLSAFWNVLFLKGSKTRRLLQTIESIKILMPSNYRYQFWTDTFITWYVKTHLFSTL